jgi:ABC-2 type transport system ATP-binding protein
MSIDAVILSEVSKTYKGEPKAALLPFSLILKTGQITGLIGPDGAGKTTLMQIMSGLILPTQGDVSVYGWNTKTNSSEIHNLLGYMPQRFALYEELTVRENLELYANLKNVPYAQMAESLEKMYHFTRLGEFKDRQTGALSGGMKQKLGLACAMLGNPKLLLLDEPGVGVDPISRQELWGIVQGIVQQDIAVVWATAYLDEAEKCDQVLLLNEGKVLYSGQPHDLTKTMKGRVFLLKPKGQDRRLYLDQIMMQSGVVDGLVQGNQVRVVMEAGKKLPKETQGISTPARFEDAFIDILGGSPRGISPLAKNIQAKGKLEELPIEAIDLTKKFGTFTAAGDINFSVKQGEIFGFLGPNGAGKSTTFKMLCGLLKPTHGQALVLGMDLKMAGALARRRIGYMAQKFSLYSNLSVRQNLAFFSGVYGLQGAKARHKVEEMLEIFDLIPYVNMNAGILPLGFKQRLALACSVMHEPDVLFLDEPTSGVDPIIRREFWLHINQMVHKGMTIMVTTHFMEEAENCDRIALIYRSRCIALGTPDELKCLAHKSAKDGQKGEFPTLEEAFISLVQNTDLKEEG